MKKTLAVILVVLCVVTVFAGCSKPEPKKTEDITLVDFKALKKQELGTMMPDLLFANDGKIAFWGTFGLYVINGEDGSIYRSVNLGNIGYNNMGGELTTVFSVSPDYKVIYFFNVDDEDNNIENFYYMYDIEEGVVRQVPITDEVKVREEPPIFFVNDLGGPEIETGYTSDPVFYKDDTVVYLHAEDWYVKDLEVVLYNHATEEYTRYKIFE